jgi:site-specific DNA recombinase
MKRAVVYLRVSTPSQVNTDYDPEGNSIPAQRRACERKVAEMEGVEIVREFVEPGRSATSVEGRPVFREMVRWIRDEGDVDFVVCYAFSRVFRNTVDAAITKRDLKKVGCRVISTVLDLGDGPEADMVESVMHAVDQYQSAANGADVRYKMGEKAKKGGTITRAPLGYRNVREPKAGGGEIATVVLDEDRAPFVRQAFELYATGEWTLAALADELTTRGLRTRPGRYPAGQISTTKLRALLADPYYIGKVVYQDEVYEGRHEALIDRDLFDRVQHVMAARSSRGQRQRKHHHYLKGTIWCGACHRAGLESRMVVSNNTGRGGTYRYFVCTHKQHGCNAPYIHRDIAEEAIACHYRTIRLPAGTRADLRQQIETTLDDDRATALMMSNQAQRELAKLDVQEENLLDLAADGSVSSGKIRTRLRAIEDRRERLQADLADVSTRLIEGAQVLEAVLDLLDDPEQLYRKADDRGRRLLNQAIFERIYLFVDDVSGDEVKKPFRELVHAGRRTERSVMSPAAPAWGGPEAQSQKGKIPPQIGRDLSAVLKPARFGTSGEGSNKALMVGLAGFEPTTSSSRTRRATKLRYSP